MTIKEIAKALNLSTTTVSVCLSSRERDPRYLIRAEKAEIVRAFAREHGYVPDLTARHLRSNNRIPPVGIVFSQRSGFEKFFPAIRMAMARLDEHGREYHVVGYAPSRLYKALEILRGIRVRDVIMFESLSEPCPVNYPLSFIRNSPESIKKVDEYIADWSACESLLKSMTMYVTDYYFPRPVSGGVKTGMVRMGANLLEFVPAVLRKIKESGMGPVATVSWNGQEHTLVPEIIDSPELIFSVQRSVSRYDEGRLLTDRILKIRKDHYFRSIFIGNDALASGVIAELCDRGFSVPDDIAVLGWGNDEPSSCCRVPLSTYKCFFDEFTGKALDAILHNVSIPDEICRQYEYIERKSFVFPEKVN